MTAVKVWVLMVIVGGAPGGTPFGDALFLTLPACQAYGQRVVEQTGLFTGYNCVEQEISVKADFLIPPTDLKNLARQSPKKS